MSNQTLSEHLLKQLNNSIKAFHTQVQTLDILFRNLEGDWFALNQAYLLLKDEIKNEEES